jgi:hypothetical protein
VELVKLPVVQPVHTYVVGVKLQLRPKVAVEPAVKDEPLPVTVQLAAEKVTVVEAPAVPPLPSVAVRDTGTVPP